MQSEELNKVLSTDQFGIKEINKMTCSGSNESLNEPISDSGLVMDDISRLSDDGIRFENINLDDDIEKVEVSSLSSSEITDHENEVDEDELESTNTQLDKTDSERQAKDFKTWLQKLAEMQNDIQKRINSQQITSSQPQCMSTSFSLSKDKVKNPLASTQNNPNRVVKYQDLPYMGEITLDNSKPRRGRKPKKADICHLIYKNYGTILPGTPNAKNYLGKGSNPHLKKQLNEDKKNSFADSSKTDVQNKIISSLLEKRLTQEYIRNKEGDSKKSCSSVKKNQNEPLNLCVRDLNQLKIKFMKNSENTYTTSEVKPKIEPEQEIVGNQSSSPCSSAEEPRIPELISADNLEDRSKYVYWPNAGVFIHPMALQQQLLYYQKLAGTNASLAMQNPNLRPPPDVIPISNKKPELRKLVPKLKPKNAELNRDTDDSSIREPMFYEGKSKRNLGKSSADRTPAKRKRSAIFIPPIQTENNHNPATEVSICKFKFTGGAKPSLQEKKMLSVDSGGNFRYYSGTGDKSMRGYEFFPRETLQQQANATQGSSTGAFLQASGEKIFPSSSVDLPESQVKSEFLLTPELPASALNQIEELNEKHKKRKSRKSLQREKLEQTFKEKGFLIQTQQLESAEGATYCKFRQLRKFTRYLFRSWKDYLPGNVAEGQEVHKSENDEVLSEKDLESLGSSSPG